MATFDSGVKTRSLKDYADLHTEQILAIRERLNANLDWVELEEVYLEAAPLMLCSTLK